jgi:glycosyltransferase involved in cell wall biosynthesis
MKTPIARSVTKTPIALYVCTHQRNDELRRLLESVVIATKHVEERAEVGVVVVDDNPDGRAQSVVDSFENNFSLGLHYRHSGKQNIAIARNIGFEAALELGDWVLMTDDDIVVPADWFAQHLGLQDRTGADATTGPALLTFEHGGDWIRDQPFDQVGLLDYEEESKPPECSTGNSMVRSAFFVEHPEIRFDPGLGVAGGEDMVFYRGAIAAGMVPRFSKKVAVYEIEPASRSTYQYQLSRSLWMGNTEFETNLRSGQASRLRLLLRASKRALGGMSRPVHRVSKGQSPQFRYAGVLIVQGIGMGIGQLGVVLDHR